MPVWWTYYATVSTLQAVGEVPAGRKVYLCLRPEDFTLYTSLSVPASSARNRLSGKVLRLSPQGPLMRVTLDCGLPIPIVALVTRASAQEMELVPGAQVQVSFKATAAHLIVHP